MNTTANLGKAPVRTLVLQLAIPSMTAQFVNVLYSIIDRMYIGHISENGALALAGAGICGPIVTLLTSFGTLVGIGGSITMGIRMGEKNHKKAEQVLANSFLMLSIFSVLLTVSFLNNPVPVSLLSGDRKPQIRFLGNHHSGSGNLYHKSFRM